MPPKPHKTLRIKPCKKCGSLSIAFDYYFQAKLSGSVNYLWEANGFVVKPRCEECGESGIRYYETTEDAIKGFNG